MHRPQTRRPSTTGVRLAALSCLALAPLGTACNIVGPAYVFIAGPPKTEALIQLDKSKVHTILIDDIRSQLPRRALRSNISARAESDMINERVLPKDKLIPSLASYAVIRDERWTERVSIVDIGRRVGAEVIIYVVIDGWEVTRDVVSTHPRLQARIKILDAVENRRLWPGNVEGYALVVEPFDLRGRDMPTSMAQRAELEEELAERAGASIAQMFYKHITRDSARN